MSYLTPSADPMCGARTVISRLACIYAVMSICMFLTAEMVGNDTFTYMVTVSFMPIIGYLLATVGRIDTTNSVDWTLFLQLFMNALWCFAFAWVIGRVFLWLFGSASVFTRRGITKRQAEVLACSAKPKFFPFS